MTQNPRNPLYDITRSFWVDASAGTGKTHTLVERILALLESGVEASQILMLTFTNVAAQEVRMRVRARIMEKSQKHKAWARIAQLMAEHGEINAVTLHSFCHSIWQRFSVESGWGYVCSLGDEYAQKDLFNKAVKEALGDLDPGMKRLLTRHMHEDMVAPLVRQILDYTYVYDVALRAPEVKPPCRMEEIWHGIDRESLTAIGQGMSFKTQTAQRLVGVMKRIAQTEQYDDVLCVEYIGLFLTASGSLRARLCPKELAPWQERIEQEAYRIFILVQRLREYADSRMSHVFYTLLERTMNIYVDKKKSAGLADYQDMLSIMQEFLESQDTGDIREYMRHTIHHILVDESQDTSMMQWNIIVGLVRLLQQTWEDGSVMIVGDYKQSIYGFQGVQTQVTKAVQSLLESHVSTLQTVTLSRNYRSVPAVLRLVDDVGTDSQMGWPIHDAVRQQEGAVYTWNLDEGTPSERAAHVARHIAQLLGQGIVLPSTGKCIQPSDILVLSQQRDGAFHSMPEALARHGVACSGVDRARALDYPLIHAVMGLLDGVLLPHDDDAIVRLLMSVWFQYTDRDIQYIVRRRLENQSLWEAMCADDSGAFQPFVQFMRLAWRWKQRGLPVFLEWVYRSQYPVIMGVFGGIGYDALMQLCDDFDLPEGSYLGGFRSWMDQHNPVVKNVTLDNSVGVRLMSVHGSKGMEAPVVIIMDGDRVVRDDKTIWEVDGDSRLNIYTNGKVWKRHVIGTSGRSDENMRLLYVAMTRAEDILVVCGQEQSPQGTWRAFIDRVISADRHEGTLAQQSGAAWTPGEPPVIEPLHTVYKEIKGGQDGSIRHTEHKQWGRMMHSMLGRCLRMPHISREGIQQWLAHVDEPQQKGLMELVHACCESEAFRFLQRRPNIETECTMKAVVDGICTMGRPDYISWGEKDMLIVDIKTACYEQQQDLPDSILQQMRRYECIARALYPKRDVRCGIFSAHGAQLIWLDRLS